MKYRSLQIIIVLVLLSGSIIAQNLIAVQNGGEPEFFTSLDSAIVHAQVGDTLYLPGGYISTSGTIFIDKALNIIGVGYHPDSNNITGNTIIQHNIEILSSVNGGSITGIYAKTFSITIHDTVSNFKISRCYLKTITIGNGLGSIPASNITIFETIADYGIYSNCTSSVSPQNVFISNCFIGNKAYLGQLAIGTNSGYWENSVFIPFNWNGLNCKNSIIYGYSYWYYYGGRQGIIKGIQYSLFENCVFNDPYNYFGDCTNNTYRNCVFNQNSGYVAGAPINLVYNCIFDQAGESIFISAPGTNFTLENNYHLNPTSPGKNAGADGTDMGLYGGSFPWKDGGNPFNPHFQSKTIAGSTDQNGNLNVNIKVAAQDH